MKLLKVFLIASLMCAASSSYASFDSVSISQWANQFLTQDVIPRPVITDPGQGEKKRVGFSKPSSVTVPVPNPATIDPGQGEKHRRGR